MANKVYNYINSLANALGLSSYDGLLAKQTSSTTTRQSTNSTLTQKTPVSHTETVGDEYGDLVGVYYVNYPNIYNTLNRNIGGGSYMSGDYDVLDEGENLGQRTNIIFDQSERKKPIFLDDKERDAYTNYLKYISDKFGTPTYYDSTLLEEDKLGYSVGVKNGFYIGESVNPNDYDTDSLLGKLSSVALGYVVDGRNVRRKERGFTSITNINYYDKGRTDIEESEGIEAIPTAIGFSYSQKQPNFGIKPAYAFTGFTAPTVDYSYASVTQRYTLFDNYGSLTDGIISLTNSPAYNSIKKSASTGENVVEMAQFLIDNLSYKGTMSSSDSFVTYFGMQNIDVAFEDTDAKDRYAFIVDSMPQDGNRIHSDFHYDEGQLDGSGYNMANGGTNHGIYITSNALYGSYTNDLSSITNKAFMNNKYDTIISRFATQNKGRGTGGKSVQVDGQEQFQSAVSNQFGMSHGRNLLKVKNNGNNVDTSGGNGYDNPYCRVWTYHHQYNRICDTIRPFTTVNSDGATCTIDDYTSSAEIAKHRNSLMKIDKDTKTDPTKQTAAYKVVQSEGQNLLHEESVRNKINGLVNITPTNKDLDGENKVDVKHCMFSIENLAWKDVLKTRSNITGEHIGPLGGRIMWFPPYGLTFSENVSSNWNSVSFIGRGENVYTYSNTERSGNLSFILLIDHPSILNEWNKDDTNGDDGVDDITSTEQKILRFFAGCEALVPFEEEKIEEKKTEPEPIPEPEKEPEKGQFSFLVYYPNNYSGRYDTPEQAISYLLNGVMFGEAIVANNLHTAFEFDKATPTQDLLDTLSKLQQRSYVITITNASGGTDAYNRNLYKERVATIKANLPQGTTATYQYGGINENASEAVVNIAQGSSNEFDLKYDILNYKYTYTGDSFMGGYEMHATSASTSWGVSTPHFRDNDYVYSATTLYQVSNGKKTMDYYHWIPLTVDEGSQQTKMNFYCPYNHTVYKNSKKTIDRRHSWGYRIDYNDANVYQQSLVINKTNEKERAFSSGQYDNYLDSISYGLNAKGYNNGQARKTFEQLWTESNGQVYSLADVVAALMPDYKDSLALKDAINEDNVKDIQKFVNYGISKLRIKGSASVQGNYKGSAVNTSQGQTVNSANDTLSQYRASTIKNWLLKQLDKNDIEMDNSDITMNIEPRGTSKKDGSVDDLQMKIERFAAVTIYYDESISINARENNTEFISSGDTSGGTIPTSERSGDVTADNSGTSATTLDEVEANASPNYKTTRYDDESLFFKNLQTNDPFLHAKIKDKIKYFDPAFHSITPEGFASRLTFLHQCTRQGATIGASDVNNMTATNLAFGRPPVCVLRIGDFYYTKIVIDSLNITYENGSGIQWDLNPEGIGIMPMYAKVDINFKFIGGSDLKGPIGRLQNALSFNYYANTRVYDNRSDAIEYNRADKGYDGSVNKITPWLPDIDTTTN